LAVVFGSVGIDWRRRNEDGRVRKYNALFVAADRAWSAPAAGPYPFVVKTLLPNYREFDESRHFFDLRKLALEEGKSVADLIAPVRVRGLTLGCAICEDAWDADYSVSPFELLRAAGPDLYLNISSSPFTLNKNRKRHRLYTELARRLNRPLLYVNNVGIQNNGKTVFTFDGASCAYDSRGGRVAIEPPFAEGELTVEVPLEDAAAFGTAAAPREDGIEAVCRALDYGTRKFLSLCGVSRVVVGVSGGIDSAVVAALYRRLLPAEDLLLVNMPSRYNSPTTRGLARQLADNLGAAYAEVSIEEAVALTRRQLDGLAVRPAAGAAARRLALTPFMMENVQARDRSARVLAALAAAWGGVFTCNANKSELTVGYGTLYGDLAGFLANLADLWKTEVYALARYLNAEVYDRPVIPEGCLTVTPSAELSPEQNVDEGRGDPLIYAYHDTLFRSWVEWWNRAAPEDILGWYAAGTLARKLGYAGRIEDLFPTAQAFVADLERWWNLYQGLGVAKRIQAPPVLAVKRRAFGFDYRESQLGARYTERYRRLRESLLHPDAPGRCPPENASGRPRPGLARSPP